MLGCNHITLEVLEQLEKQVELYRRQHKVVVRVVGFGSNCCRFIYNPKGFEWSEIKQRLTSCTSTAKIFTEHATGSYTGAPSVDQLDAIHDLPIPILIDCSDQGTNQDLYLKCIERGIHVVVYNARSVSTLPQTQSRESVATATRPGGRTFLMYTSTIAASVPVIDTLGNILRTGDRVQKIDTSLSGAMGFVTNEVMQGKKLSQAVKDALLNGYCERDPRDDITGRNMAYKTIVLARALGAHLRLSDISVEPLIPQSILDNINWTSDISIDEIVRGIQTYDDIFHQKFYEKARSTATRLRYVASIDLSSFPTISASIAPRLVDEDHPAFFAKHDEIAFGFLTNEYQPRPLVLKGSGTGALASATGILRDVLTILKSLRQV